jgi:hypothetical protein
VAAPKGCFLGMGIAPWGIMIKNMENKEINWCCSSCGLEANRLTCLKKYGSEPKKKCFDVSTFHEGICDCCGKKGWITQTRDFFFPDFSLLKSLKEKINDKKTS